MTILRILAVPAVCLLLSRSAFGLSIDDWVKGDDFAGYELIDQLIADGSFFALFRSETEIVAASRKLVRIGSVGGHRDRLELLNREGVDLISTGAFPARQLRTDAEPCGEFFCDLDIIAYLIDSDFRGELTYQYRWQWITSDVTDVHEMRQYIIDYLKDHELPVVMRGEIEWE